MELATVLTAVGTALSVVQTLSSVLQTQDLKDALSLFGYKSQLDGLKQTVKSIDAVLRDAEAKPQLSAQDQIFIESLKDAVFEADDLFDEVLTLAAQKKLIKTDGSISQKLTNLLSRSKNPFTMSRKIKSIQKKLDAIAYDNQFSFKIDPQPIKERSHRETDSYVNEAEIIGREHDLEKIVGTLLASSDDQTSNNNVSVLSIVGMGGLGKTALAQLVFKDPRVTEAFPLKMWTCVSDEGQDELNVKHILGNILGRNQDGFTLEQVQEPLRAKLEGKKFLLVLDDLWTEDGHQWGKLVKYLNGNKRGSWILVTTRSKKTAAAITDGQMYELSGLSKENSWSLFEKLAFNSKQSHPLDENLVSIGKQIVDGCGGVPLAIKVAGSLLYGQDKSKWLSVQQNGLANTGEGERNIMRILKLSYYHLESPLRSCFSYCALFPKDFRMDKDMLIRLWMAQGYITPLIGQTIEDAGEEYFSILLKRCFFQDIQKYGDGEIKSCKIHDLMHDIAQKVSGKEIYSLNTNIGNVDKNVRHLSIFNLSQLQKCYFSNNTHIRSLFSFDFEYHCELAEDTLVKSFKYLRMLHLKDKYLKCLPDSIGELIHLRYIDLSQNRMIEVLPNSITKLCNLETLILSHCLNLRELPKDLSRLVKLRVLDIVDMEGCRKLRCMPRGMSNMTCLHTMKGQYKVGGEGRPRCKSWKQWLDMLEDLKPPINLKGKLEISVLWPEKNLKNDVKEGSLRKGLHLKCLEHLENLNLRFSGGKDSGLTEGIREIVMEDLQPHSNLKELIVWDYDGVKFPSWSLPNLVTLEMHRCVGLKYLPWLGKHLCHLKYLSLVGLRELEYIMIIEEESRELASTTSTAHQNVPFYYPSLEELTLEDLPKFRGWRRGVELEETMQLCLPRLKKLSMRGCEEFTNSLRCPMLETLTLCYVNEGMQIYCTNTNDGEKSSEEAAIQNPTGITLHNVPNLRQLTVHSGAWLDSIPMESFHCLRELHILDYKMVELPNNLQYSPALQTLKMHFCINLKEMPNWMPKLTSLKELSIKECSESLHSRCKKDPAGEDWPLIQHIPNITNLR